MLRIQPTLVQPLPLCLVSNSRTLILQVSDLAYTAGVVAAACLVALGVVLQRRKQQARASPPAMGEVQMEEGLPEIAVGELEMEEGMLSKTDTTATMAWA